VSRAARSRAAWSWLLLLGVPVAAAGVLAFAVGSGRRAALSFLVGFAVATLTVSVGAVLVQVAGRIAPQLAMVAALSNYALTVLFFLVLLAVVGPTSADVPAFATGLAASVVPYLGWQFAQARPRQ
jgi:hypothetical protein